MKADWKTILISFAFGALAMYGWLFRESSLVNAYNQGRIDVVQSVCGPVTGALVEFKKELKK